MGREFIAYHLTESKKDECVFYSAFIDYRLVDGTKLHILQQPAWCPNCDGFVIAEEVPSVKSLELEIQKYRTSHPDTLKMWDFVSDGRPVQDRIDELTRYIEWRRKRKSPPRCLECGGTAITPIPTSGRFPHPQTGDKVVVGESGWADTEPWIAEFSPEGVRL